MATDPATGTAIKRARERRRWTQQQLAAALGVNVKTVDNWENGRSRPRNSIGAIEDVLGISLGGEPGEELTPAEWEAGVLADEGLPMESRIQLIEDARRARRAYRDARSRRRAEEERQAAARSRPG